MATTFQTSSFLIELPQELRDMIYNHVFSEYTKLPAGSSPPLSHPLMRTSKQLRAEARVPSIKALAQMSMLCIGCDLNELARIGCHFNCIAPGGPRPRWTRTTVRCSRWSVFRQSNFAHDFVPQLQQIFLTMPPMGNALLTVDFGCNRLLHIEADFLEHKSIYVREGDYKKLYARVKAWENEFSGCSVGWIEKFLLNMRDAWKELGDLPRMDYRRWDVLM